MGHIENYTGDVQGNRVVVLDNLQFSQATAAGYNGLLLQLGAEGLIGLRRIPDQDTHWNFENTNEITLDASPNELLGVVIDADITAEDGYYFVVAKVSNPNAEMTTLQATAKANGQVITAFSVELEKNIADQVVLINGYFKADWISGDTFSVAFSSDGNSLTLHGDNYATALRVSKAVTPATTRSLVESFGQLQRMAQNSDTVYFELSKKPTRDELLTASQGLSDFDPTVDRNFFCVDVPQNRLFFVKYIAGNMTIPGNYFYEKLSMAQ